MVDTLKVYTENMTTNFSATSPQKFYFRPYRVDYSSLQDNIKDIVEQLYSSEIERIESLLNEFLIGKVSPLSFVKSIHTKYSDDALRFVVFIFTEPTTLDDRREVYRLFADFKFNFMNTVFDYFVLDLSGRNINDFIDGNFTPLLK